MLLDFCRRAAIIRSSLVDTDVSKKTLPARKSGNFSLVEAFQSGFSRTLTGSTSLSTFYL
jgi:hypothetical protein